MCSSVLKYEQLILNTRDVFSQLLVKTGIPYFEISNSRGDLFNRLPISHQAIHGNIEKKPIINKCTYWKQQLSMNGIFILQKIAGKQLSILGYELQNYKFAYFRFCFSFIYFFISYLLNLITKKTMIHLKMINKKKNIH